MEARTCTHVSAAATEARSAGLTESREQTDNCCTQPHRTCNESASPAALHGGVRLGFNTPTEIERSLVDIFFPFGRCRAARKAQKSATTVETTDRWLTFEPRRRGRQRQFAEPRLAARRSRGSSAVAGKGGRWEALCHSVLYACQTPYCNFAFFFFFRYFSVLFFPPFFFHLSYNSCRGTHYKSEGPSRAPAVFSAYANGLPKCSCGICGTKVNGHMRDKSKHMHH